MRVVVQDDTSSSVVTSQLCSVESVTDKRESSSSDHEVNGRGTNMLGYRML